MKRHVVCKVGELEPGGRRIVEIEGRSIGLFNVEGRFFALRNRCPHRGGPACEGPLSGTALPVDSFKYVYGWEGRIVRCAWHGWEFDVETGRALVDPGMGVRTYPVTVEGEDVVVWFGRPRPGSAAGARSFAPTRGRQSLRPGRGSLSV